MNRIDLLIIALLLLSCNHKKSTEIRIIGKVSNIPAKKLYLADAYEWNVFLDSADYKNDTFSFNVKSDKFEPYIASISFIDSTGKVRPLTFQNYILATEDKKYAYAAFVLDKGITTISGTFNNSPTVKTDKLKLIGSKQNDPFFQTQLSDFGWISAKDKRERETIIKRYKKLIRQYPYSFYFFKTLYEYRTQYAKEELVEMLALFNSETKQWSYNQKFSDYFKVMPVPGAPLKNYVLMDSLNQSSNIINADSKVNMIIFWASWCGPCRKEIPNLKIIYEQFKNKGVDLVSVSIDEKAELWKEALLKEKMSWRQLLVGSALANSVKNSFNFSSIPLIIITDSKGLEIARFSGYNPDEKDLYESVIEKYLKNHN